MSARTHQLLSELSERQSESEAETLKKLTDYKQTLSLAVEHCELELSQLITQREQHFASGAAAMDLMMLDQSLTEQEAQLQELAQEIEVLDQAIKEQRQKWALIRQRHKVHEKMGQAIAKQESRSKAHKQQKTADQQFSAQMVMRRGVSSS
ncbi:MAG: hypothetical protein AUK35_07375 [Zetaproteobacteria bacterium CG2_30_46_52]|nr:MAG: hypothetical protein AUK35_07375 [Zetaproteobacteria bacterium CG2_30_46_52]